MDFTILYFIFNVKLSQAKYKEKRGWKVETCKALLITSSSSMSK